MLLILLISLSLIITAINFILLFKIVCAQKNKKLNDGICVGIWLCILMDTLSAGVGLGSIISIIMCGAIIYLFSKDNLKGEDK